MERSRLLRLIELIRAVLVEHDDVLFTYLFGSAVKGSFREGSDLDIAVFFLDRDAGQPPRQRSVPRARRALALEAELERAVGYPIQVVPLNDTPLGLEHNILKTGATVMTRDHSARRRHYVDHARRYYDMEGARRVFDRYRARRIQEGTFGDRGRYGS